MKIRRLIVVCVLILLIANSAVSEFKAVKRPRILGLAHVAFYVSDLAKARAFYKDFLGYEEPFSLKRDDGSDRIAFIKINDEQYVELFAEPPKNPESGRLNHIAFYVDSAAQMRDYLAAKGIKVPDRVGKGKTGNFNFTITDPDGHGVEFVEYQPDSESGKNKGKFMPATRISSHIMHAGITVGSVDPAMKFYQDILGFKEFWRGSANGSQLSWINMRVPDGNDYIEFMLYQDPPSLDQLGVKNHLCLTTPDVTKEVSDLQLRIARKSYERVIAVQVGKNRKRQANLYDPDGTRIELMEPTTIDGKPMPSSGAPPPR